MNSLVSSVQSSKLPALICAAGERAQTRFFEFFVSNIRNPNTRRAYVRAIGDFLAWCEHQGVASIADRQAAARRDPHAIRLAGDGTDHAGQSGRLRARAAACGQDRQDAGARSGRGARASRQH